jgi:uncharacterized protein YPO0396
LSLIDVFYKKNSIDPSQINSINDSINELKTLNECINKTKDSFDLFYFDDSAATAAVKLNNKKFENEFEKFKTLLNQLQTSNLSQNQLVLNLDKLKNLIEFKFSSILKQQQKTNKPEEIFQDLRIFLIILFFVLNLNDELKPIF